jgi:hypothetical protein
MKSLVALTTAVLGGTLVAASGHVSAEERFVVSGLVVLDGGDGSAWLQEPSLTENQIVRVRRGDSVGPWRVTRILEDRVELEGPAGSVDYVILGGARGPIAPPPVAVEKDPQTRALAHLLGTGGDEGVWDDGESASSPPAAAALSPPAAPRHQ